MMPLTESLRATLPDVLQAWYADDSAFGRAIPDITAAMQLILAKGPA